MSKDIDEGKACAALAYFLIGIIWYFVDEKMKKNQYTKFHVQQGIVLLISSVIFCVVYGVIFTILSIPLAFIPILGWMVIFLLSLVFWVPFVFAIIGLVHAIQGKQKELPVIGSFGKKFRI